MFLMIYLNNYLEYKKNETFILKFGKEIVWIIYEMYK